MVFNGLGWVPNLQPVAVPFCVHRIVLLPIDDENTTERLDRGPGVDLSEGLVVFSEEAEDGRVEEEGVGEE